MHDVICGKEHRNSCRVTCLLAWVVKIMIAIVNEICGSSFNTGCICSAGRVVVVMYGNIVETFVANRFVVIYRVSGVQ